MILDSLAAALGFAAILWTLLPLFRHEAWWIRAFEFPRIQVTLLSAAVIVIYAALAGWREPQDRLILAVLSVCIAFQLARIARYTPLWPKQLLKAVDPRPADTLGLLVANVLTPNRNADGLIAIIRDCDPDVVLAVETDRWWESRLDAPTASYQFSIKHPLDNLYGMHLYSKLELVDPSVLFLVEDDVPSIHVNVVLRSGHPVELHCLHPAPPSPTENPTSAERDAELLLVANSVAPQTRSVVVMGDLNDVAWSATTRLFQRLSGLLDPRVGRGPCNTFHAQYPLLRWPLDHVFCSSDFMLVSLARLRSFGSDHFPMYAVLCHVPKAEEAHEPPRAGAQEQAWLEEKIEQVDVNDDAIDAVVPKDPRGR